MWWSQAYTSTPLRYTAILMLETAYAHSFTQYLRWVVRSFPQQRTLASTQAAG